MADVGVFLSDQRTGATVDSIIYGLDIADPKLTPGNGRDVPFFDNRVYHNLGVLGEIDINGEKVSGIHFSLYPFYSYGSYVTDFYESPGSLAHRIAELESIKASGKVKTGEKEITNSIQDLKERKELVETFITENHNNFLAPHSMIHPYALIKLAGLTGSAKKIDGESLLTPYGYDRFYRRKWYEIEGDAYGHYAQNPTTTKIIQWGAEDPRGRTPYTFQDFVFCKDWNIVPNNHMITLRRYAMPVTDNIEFDAFEEVTDEDARLKGEGKNLVNPNAARRRDDMGWAPLATAVTYFGDNTGNKLSDILNFTAKYNWEEVTAESNPIAVDAEANEMGDSLINSDNGLLTGAMHAMSIMSGFQRAINGGVNPMFATNNGLPPDPYSNGPYENRIIGPINVIMNTIKRKRGLLYTNDIKVKFSYIARPISGINTKAVLLDLLSNMLIMCYASGTWFGGVERFRAEPKGIYPFTAGKVMNKLYSGKLFGENGAIKEATTQAWSTGTGTLKDIWSEALADLKNLCKAAISAVEGLVNGITGDSSTADAKKKEASQLKEDAFSGKFFTGVQNLLAAKVLSGAQVPWIHNKKALLTGEAVGDWHLTVGNPFNPIAMIGNLVCKGVSIEWMDELGPDDFPIGFTATVELAHGLGRDKDAIESMYNRGFGRIYSLPEHFVSSADQETKVDKNTGLSDPYDFRNTYEMWGAPYIGGGGVSLGDRVYQSTTFANTASKAFNSSMRVQYNSLIKTQEAIEFPVATYAITPYHMKWLL